MDKNNWIFLTRSELLDAVAFDFQQYGPQAALFSELAGRMPGKMFSAGGRWGGMISWRWSGQMIPAATRSGRILLRVPFFPPAPG